MYVNMYISVTLSRYLNLISNINVIPAIRYINNCKISPAEITRAFSPRRNRDYESALVYCCVRIEYISALMMCNYTSP